MQSQQKLGTAGVTLEHINQYAIDFENYADTNTFSNVHFEDVNTCIYFKSDPSVIGNTVYTPFFGAGLTTNIQQGGSNNRVTGNITTWVLGATNALRQGWLPEDIGPRSRFSVDGSIAMGDGIENPVDTTSNNVGFIEPRTSLLKNYDANWENPHGTHNGSSNVNYLQDSTKNFYTYGVRTGMTVKNTTDHCTGTITSITTTTNTNDTLNFAPGGLTGGTDNDFDSGDGYTVYNTKNHPAIAVGLQGVFSKVEDIVSTEVAAKRTTDANTVNLWYRTLPEGDAYLVEAYVVAKQGDTNRASYIRRTLVYRTIGGNATIQGTVDNVFTRESDTSWDCTMDVNGGNIRVRITGAANNIDWKGSVRVIPVID
jgi:hypothetical protein